MSESIRSQRYAARGVSAQKEDVHAAIRGTDPGLFPGAFCKIVPDHLSGDEAYCLVMHADGAGTKSSLAYLVYRETGDASIFQDLAQDALVMNVDDLLCVGALGPFLVSNTIGRNKGLVPGEVIAQIIAGFENQARRFAEWGIDLQMTGGETADVGDLVRTLILDSTVTARMRRTDVIDNQGVRPGDVIIGLASFGQTTYETTYNSGMGSNGLTSARHDLLHSSYGADYPESFDPQIPDNLRYSGPHALNAPLPSASIPIGQAMLSPTRTYAPIIKSLLENHRAWVSALVHCSGGGQTKSLRVGQGIHYVKNKLFDPPPLFAEIQRVTGSPWREMYQVFNMGHRMEVIGDEKLVPVMQKICGEFNLEMRVVGHCEATPDNAGNRVTITAPDGKVIVYESSEI